MNFSKTYESKLYFVLQMGLAFCLTVLLASCAAVDPGKVDVELKKTAPQMKVTTYTQALSDLGLMSEIYASGSLKIQSNPIGDQTGTAQSTGGEIPRDITEMLKSSLNSIGGNITFIPYDPAYIQNQMVTGYSNFENKLIPDVVISGGITEFDRGLETRGENTDVGAEAEFTGMKDWLPSKRVSVDYGSSSKDGLARITLDFNLLDFRTMAGIAKMNTVNSMEVAKAMGNKELGITIFGPTFGRKGSIKKVQGRHAAVRLLVELSMIQIVGKHLVMPYWRLLGDENEPDNIVITALQRSYYNLSEQQRTAMVQEWLYLHGYDVDVTGSIGTQTVAAMQNFEPTFDGSHSISVDSFIEIYTTIPIDEKTLGRRNQLYRIGQQASAVNPVVVAPQVQQVEVVEQVAQVAQVAQAAQAAPVVQVAASQAAPAPVAAPVVKKGIGRILSDEEW